MLANSHPRVLSGDGIAACVSRCAAGWNAPERHASGTPYSASRWQDRRRDLERGGADGHRVKPPCRGREPPRHQLPALLWISGHSGPATGEARNGLPGRIGESWGRLEIDALGRANILHRVGEESTSTAVGHRVNGRRELGLAL